MALLTIIMPVYNGAAYLSEAIDSVLQQTLGDFDLLIMDDGSTDETPAILKSYAGQDKRIRLFLRQHQGQIACRNELLGLATTEVVACADADDICLPDRLERQLAAMMDDRDLWILGTSAISIDRNGRRRRPWRVPTGSVAVGAELDRRCCIVHPSCMMRVKEILSIGGYRPAYECAEDYDLFLRANEHGKVDNLNMVGVLYRQHGGNVSHRRSLQQAISADLARATYFLRLAGGTDPTDGLARAPAADDPLLEQLLSPARTELYRAIAIALDPAADALALDRAAKIFLQGHVDKKRARTTQRAIMRLIRRRPFDGVSVKLAARAAALGPGRLARLLFTRQG
jgi:glycosyltransferase involved in cell wall biosynthesis